MKLKNLTMMMMFVVMMITTTTLMIFVIPQHDENDSSSNREMVIVVPGGGITEDGEMREWVKARCDAAARVFFENSGKKRNIFLLSRGTTWKPPPVDFSNRPIHESSVSMRYLVQNLSIPIEYVFEENVSLDSIGNAFFLRVMHLDVMFPKNSVINMLVVTNSFHMARTRVIFEWIFGLPGTTSTTTTYRLNFHAVENEGLDVELLRLRKSKERKGIKSLTESLIPRIRSMKELHSFLYREHNAYRSECVVSPLKCFHEAYTCHLNEEGCSAVSSSY